MASRTPGFSATAPGRVNSPRRPRTTAYWLTPDFQHVNIGLALLALGEHDAAAEHLQAGLESLPPDQRDATWTAESRNALRQAREAS